MHASIIICTYRRDAVLCETIERVLAVMPASCELVVVDQVPAHDPATDAFLATAVSAGRIRLLTLDKAGLTHARNAGANAARGEILVFFDDDILPSPTAVTAHLDAYDDPEVRIVAGQVLNEGDAPIVQRGSFSHNLRETDWHQVYGANFSINRNFYFEIGGSDENIGVHSYVEDRILSDRSRDRGARILYEPAASVVHLLAPCGGCRITDRSQPTREWEKSFGILYYAIQYKRRSLQKWHWIRTALRCGPLRKDIVFRPWLWPSAWLGFLEAILRAAVTKPATHTAPSINAPSTP